MVAGLIASLEQSGNDRVTILSEAGARSSTARVEVQEGVIRAIGEGAKAAGAARPVTVGKLSIGKLFEFSFSRGPSWPRLFLRSSRGQGRTSDCWHAFAGTFVSLAIIGQFSPDYVADGRIHCMARPRAVEKPPRTAGKIRELRALHGMLALISPLELASQVPPMPAFAPSLSRSRRSGNPDQSLRQRTNAALRNRRQPRRAAGLGPHVLPEADGAGSDSPGGRRRADR